MDLRKERKRSLFFFVSVSCEAKIAKLLKKSRNSFGFEQEILFGKARGGGVGWMRCGLFLFVEVSAQEGTEAGGGFALVGVVVVIVGLTDGESDLAFFGVKVDDADADFLSFFEFVGGVFDAIIGDLGDMDETFDPGFEFNESAKVGEFFDVALPDGAFAVADGDMAAPRIGADIFDGEGEALVLFVDVGDDGFDFLAFFKHFRGMFDALNPRDIGDVDEAVDAFFDTDKDAEVGDIADLADDLATEGIFLFELAPRVGFDLFHAEADTTVVDVDIEDNSIDGLADVDDFGGVFDAFGPRHLGDVDETFDAFFDLDESAVIGEANDFAGDAGCGWIASFGVVPWVFGDLFESEGDAFGV